jgi:hypothetical protein
LDGSKVKANASKHKAMSYGRMQEDEKRLQAEAKRLLEQAEKVDAEEDARYGRAREKAKSKGQPLFQRPFSFVNLLQTRFPPRQLRRQFIPGPVTLLQ